MTQNFVSSHGEQIAKSPITPAIAEHNGQKVAWQPGHTYQGLIGIPGGLNQRALVASFVEGKIGDTPHRFVELQKNDEWCVKGVGGPGTQIGDVKSVTVLQDIREAVLKLKSAVEPAVAETEIKVEGDDDEKIQWMPCMRL